MTNEAIVDYVLGLDRDTLIFYLMRDLTSFEAVYEGTSGTKVKHYVSTYPKRQVITMTSAYGWAVPIAHSKAVELYGMDALNKVRLAYNWPELRDARIIYITHLLHREKYATCPYVEATHIRAINDNGTFEFLHFSRLATPDWVLIEIAPDKKIESSIECVEILLGPNCWYKKCYADILADMQKQRDNLILEEMAGKSDEDQVVYHRIYRITPSANNPNTEYKWCVQFFDAHYGPFDSYEEAKDFRPSKMAQSGEVIRTPHGLRRINEAIPINDGQIVLTAELYALAGCPIPTHCILVQAGRTLYAVRRCNECSSKASRYMLIQRCDKKVEWEFDGRCNATNSTDLSDTPARVTWDLLPEFIKETVI